MSDVKKRYHKVYRIAKEKGWHEKLKQHCLASKQKWTREACEAIVRKYVYLKDFIKYESKVYRVIKKHHWEDLLLLLKRVQHVPYNYTLEEIKEICAPFRNMLELSKARKDIENYCRKRGIDLYRLNGWPNLRNRQVVQVLDGVEIAIFPSVSAAAKAINVPRNRMWEHVGKDEPYHGYLWRFKE